MIFTREDILKILNALLQLGRKDSEFKDANTPLNSDDEIAILQDGINKKVSINNLLSTLGLLKKDDFINVSDRYDEYYIQLSEAVTIIAKNKRKKGLVITFQDLKGDWKIYQFTGEVSNFVKTELWKDLFDFKYPIVSSVLPDEEDLTLTYPDKDGNSFIQLKDKEYDPENFSGMATKILRKNIVEVGGIKKNILTQEDFDLENCIYEIRYNFDLNDLTITIPNNCTLNFSSGTLSNGTIKFTNTYIKANEIVIFNNIVCSGNITNNDIFALWYGEIDNGIDSSIAINRCLTHADSLSPIRTVLLPNKSFTIDSTIYIHKSIVDGRSEKCSFSPYISVRKPISAIIIATGYNITHIKNIGITASPSSEAYKAFIGLDVKNIHTSSISSIRVENADIGIRFMTDGKPITMLTTDALMVRECKSIGILLAKGTTWMTAIDLGIKQIDRCLHGIEIHVGDVAIRGTCEIGDGGSQVKTMKRGLVMYGGVATIKDIMWAENIAPFWATIQGDAILNISAEPYIFTGIEVLELATLLCPEQTAFYNNVYSSPTLRKLPVYHYKKAYTKNSADTVGGYWSGFTNLVTGEEGPFLMRGSQDDLGLWGTSHVDFSYSDFKYVDHDISIVYAVDKLITSDSRVQIILKDDAGNRVEGSLGIYGLKMGLSSHHYTDIYVRGSSLFENVLKIFLHSTFDDPNTRIKTVVGLTISKTKGEAIIYYGNAVKKLTIATFDLPICINALVPLDSSFNWEVKVWDSALTRNEMQFALLSMTEQFKLTTSQLLGLSKAAPILAPLNTLYYATDLGTYLIKKGVTRNSEGNITNAIWVPLNVGDSGNTNERPTNPNIGFRYYDKSLKKPIVWNGSEWVNENGTSLTTMGTTEDRPTTALSIGFVYKDTTLGKLIMWDGSKWINLDGTDL